MPINNGTLNSGLNADQLDSLHANDFVYSLDTSGNYVRWKKYNGSWNNLTVPYAINSDKLDNLDSSYFLICGMRNLIVRGVYNSSITGFRWTPGKVLTSGTLNRIAFSTSTGNYSTAPYNSEGPYGYYSIAFWYKVENYSSGSTVNVNINDISCGNFDVSSNKGWTFWYGTSKERTDGNRYGFVDFEGSYSATITISDIVVVRGTNISQTWFPAPEDLVNTYSNQTIGGTKTFSNEISGTITTSTTSTRLRDSGNSSNYIYASYVKSSLSYDDMSHLVGWYSNNELRVVPKNIYSLASHNHDSSYLTITTDQTVSGKKTFNVGKLVFAGNEENEITNSHYPNSRITIDGTNIYNGANSIKNALDFRWYNSHWLIGNIRSGNTATDGFGIALKSGDLQYECLRVTTGGLYHKGQTILHSGNYSSYASPVGHTHNYLPLSGGTMSGTISFTTYPCINYLSGTTEKMRLGYYPPGGYSYFSNETNKYEIRIYDNGDLKYTKYDTGSCIHELNVNGKLYNYGIIHRSYNSSAYALTSDGGVAHIGSMSVNYANYSGYTTGTNTGNWDADNPGNYQYLWFYGQSGGVSNKPSDASYGSVINFFSNGINNSLNFQLYGSINHNLSSVSQGIWWRGKNNLGWDTNWHRLYDDNYHPSADYSSNSDKLDNIDSTGFLRYISHNTEWSTTANTPTNLIAGIHRIHVSNVEYSSILTGYDFNGAYWQLWFHPTSGYSQDIRYRASNCTSWKIILDSNNSSVSKSGETLTVKINSISQSLTNTWRGIQNNLTSDSTTDSLSAAQGKALAGRLSTIEGDYLTRTTVQTVSGAKTFNDSKWVLASAESSEITNKADYIALYNASNTGYLWASYSKVPSSIRFRWYSDYWRIGHVRSGGTPTGGFVIALESGDHLVDRFRLSSSGEGYLNGNVIITSSNISSYVSSADDTVWQDFSSNVKYYIQVVSSLPSTTNSNTFYVIV